MAAKSFVQLKVPTDPGAALEVGTQQYIDAGLAGKSDTGHNHTGTYQPLDSDLTTIAAISTGTGGVVATDGSGWIHKTYAALKTALALVKADVGLGNVDNTSNATERAAARTLTNARITKRVGSTASSATPTPSADDHDIYKVTAAAVNMTVGAPTGTPTDGQMLLMRFKDNGTARTIAWNAVFRGIGGALPNTTVISKWLYALFIWNSDDSLWDMLSSRQQT